MSQQPPDLSLEVDGLPLSLRVASTMTLFWAAIVGGATVAAGVPVIVAGRPEHLILLAPLPLLFVGLVYAGLALRRRQRRGGWAAMVFCSPFVVGPAISPSLAALVGVVVNVTILAVVIANWRKLDAT